MTITDLVTPPATRAVAPNRLVSSSHYTKKRERGISENKVPALWQLLGAWTVGIRYVPPTAAVPFETGKGKGLRLYPTTSSIY